MLELIIRESRHRAKVFSPLIGNCHFQNRSEASSLGLTNSARRTSWQVHSRSSRISLLRAIFTWKFLDGLRGYLLTTLRWQKKTKIPRTSSKKLCIRSYQTRMVQLNSIDSLDINTNTWSKHKLTNLSFVSTFGTLTSRTTWTPPWRWSHHRSQFHGGNRHLSL